MNELWIDISEIPAEGREFSFTDQAIWQNTAKGYQMDVDFSGEIRATFTVTPFGRGCAVFGTLQGDISMPCSRCLEPTALTLSQDIKISESLDDDVPTDERLLREAHGKIELDAGTILWEQFVLALPGKPLCTPQCKGLCAHCGADKNKNPCSCADSEGDPRLAALRNLKVADRKKQ